jgi:hypothetical protein
MRLQLASRSLVELDTGKDWKYNKFHLLIFVLLQIEAKFYEL